MSEDYDPEKKELVGEQIIYIEDYEFNNEY